MNLGKPVFVYRDCPAVSDPLQPEIGFVTADLSDTSVNIVGFTAHGSLFAIMAAAVQTNYDDKNSGDFVTLSPVKTKARIEQDKLDAAAQAAAKVEADRLAAEKKVADDAAAKAAAAQPVTPVVPPAVTPAT